MFAKSLRGKARMYSVPQFDPEDVAACINLLAIFMKHLHHDMRYLSN
jgi:hypothetical protein